MILRHRDRELHCEQLPPDFTVYKSRSDMGYFWRQNDGIPASRAVTSCCDSPPVKYYPDYPDNTRWWLICMSCKHAIKANGDAL